MSASFELLYHHCCVLCFVTVGLIDAGYRGEIIACLDNIKSVDYSVKKGDRLLQAIYPDLGGFAFEVR